MLSVCVSFFFFSFPFCVFFLCVMLVPSLSKAHVSLPECISLVASPCKRLSRAQSTTNESDFHIGFRHSLNVSRSGVPVGCRRRTVWISQVPGVSISDRAVLSDPAGVSRALALAIAYCSLPGVRPFRPPVVVVTRLNRFTCVTARSSLCLHLTHVVTSMSPRLDSQ